MDALVDTHIRDRLEHELDRTIPDQMWNDLVERDYAADAHDAEGWRHLVEESMRLIGYMRLGEQGLTPRRNAAAGNGPPITARGRAFAAWAARYARGDLYPGRSTWLADVRDFLGGVLTRDQAMAYLGSEAWSLVPLSDLLARDDFGRLTADDASRIRDTKARRLDVAREEVDGRRGVRYSLELEFGSELRVISVWHQMPPYMSTAAVPERRSVRFLALPGTLNGRLVGIALNNQWGALTGPQMLWLMLTDEPPEVMPLSFAVRTEVGPTPVSRRRDIISIEAEPWVPGRAVAATYREVQAALLDGPNRPPRERALELARFTAEEGWGLSVRRQMRAWNDLHPEWAVDDPGNFLKERKRAMRLLHGRESLPMSKVDDA